MTAGPGPIRAIETSYAGCRFRSRLEARWAVFFDALGISWQYEAQGYQFQSRIWGDPDFWYLPDFWLPDLGLHAEVKGTLDEQGARKIADTVACFGQLLALGEIPALERIGRGGLATFKAPTWLEFQSDDGYARLLASTWPDFDITDGHSRIQATMLEITDCPRWISADGSPDRFIKWILKGSTGFVSDSIERGFQAARTARFEHGQSGPYLGVS